MPIDENDVEKYLREFRPRAVRPAEALRSKPPAWARRLAAAAVLAGLAGSGVWFAARSQKSRPKATAILLDKQEKAAGEVERKLSILQMTKLAVEEPERLDALLGTVSRKDLTNLSGKKSLLSTLAKE